MFKARYYFIVNGDWQTNDDFVDLDSMPNVDAVEYVDGTYYKIVEVKNNNGIVDIYLD